MKHVPMNVGTYLSNYVASVVKISNNTVFYMPINKEYWLGLRKYPRITIQLKNVLTFSQST